MSTEDNLAEAAMATVTEKCCASCGVAEIDDVKLKPCPKCDRALYCSDECQQDHRERHDAECKKRAAELYDELLFKQPESNHRGDCPICFLPMNHYDRACFVRTCCGKQTCDGCNYANESRCPFCRHIQPKTREEGEKLLIERAKLNDPIALKQLGMENYLRGDYGEAFRYFTKAASLDDVVSMVKLADMYRMGKGVEEDRAKEIALLEKAAIAGHPGARHKLGCLEEDNGRIYRAVLHWIIAANFGVDNSIKALKKCYNAGYVGKDDFAAALRGYQTAVDEMKSPQREVAKTHYDSVRYKFL